MIHYFFMGAVTLFVVGLLVVGAIMDKDDLES